jgi:hypothetical protein
MAWIAGQTSFGGMTTIAVVYVSVLIEYAASEPLASTA